MTTGFDHSELGRLSADLGEVSRIAYRKTRASLTRTAVRVKEDWNEKLYTDGHARRTGRSISFDVETQEEGGKTSFVADIGPVTGSGKQAGIVRLLENGSVHNAPHGYGAAALHENEAEFERGIARALQEAEDEANL